SWKSSSTDATPTVASISSWSESVSARNGCAFVTGLLARENLLVGLDVEQAVGLVRLRQPDPDQPARAVGVLVHGLGRVDDLLVDLEHLARERRDHIGDGLDRLDLAVRLVLRHRRPGLGRLEVDELAERVGGEPGDAEHGLVALEPGPVV